MYILRWPQRSGWNVGTTQSHLISSITLILMLAFSFLRLGHHCQLTACVMSPCSCSSFHFLTIILSVAGSFTASFFLSLSLLISHCNLWFKLSSGGSFLPCQSVSSSGALLMSLFMTRRKRGVIWHQLYCLSMSSIYTTIEIKVQKASHLFQVEHFTVNLLPQDNVGLVWSDLAVTCLLTPKSFWFKCCWIICCTFFPDSPKKSDEM